MIRYHGHARNALARAIHPTSHDPRRRWVRVAWALLVVLAVVLAFACGTRRAAKQQDYLMDRGAR